MVSPGQGAATRVSPHLMDLPARDRTGGRVLRHQGTGAGRADRDLGPEREAGDDMVVRRCVGELEERRLPQPLRATVGEGEPVVLAGERQMRPE